MHARRPETMQKLPPPRLRKRMFAAPSPATPPHRAVESGLASPPTASQVTQTGRLNFLYPAKSGSHGLQIKRRFTHALSDTAPFRNQQFLQASPTRPFMCSPSLLTTRDVLIAFITTL